MDMEQLPPEIADSIRQSRRDGVSFSRRQRGTPEGTPGIYWHPGDRNALAEAIIEKVTGPTRLVLNGHPYTITPAG